MARKTDMAAGEGQLNLFPLNPAVKNLGLMNIKLRSGIIEMDFQAATEATSLDQITPEVQARAHIEHAVRLMGGQVFALDRMMSEAQGAYWEAQRAREADADIGYARQKGVGAGIAVELLGATAPPADEAVEAADLTWAVAEHLAGLGLRLAPEVIADWSATETTLVRIWIRAAREAKASGQERLAPMPDCLAASLAWLDGAEAAGPALEPEQPEQEGVAGHAPDAPAAEDAGTTGGEELEMERQEAA